MKNSLASLILLALAFTLFSCKKEDTAAPTISNVLVNEASSDIEIAAGTEVHFDATFADNEDLKEFKLDVHNNFDLHDHGKTANVRFSHQQIFSISGKSSTVHEHFDVPSDASAGPYHFILKALDQEGNESTPSELSIVITQPGQAAINVTSHDFSSEVTVDAGDTLVLAGTITDDVDIQKITIIVEEHGDHSHGKVASGEVFEAEFDLPGASDTSWDFSALAGQHIIFPTGEHGDYELIILVEDSDDNHTIMEGEVHAH